MIQQGLHIGLASWINNLREVDEFYCCTAIPESINLSNLENIQNVQDIVNGAEFSKMANFVPKQGELIDRSKKLWREHRRVLSKMEFATEPWNAEDRQQYDVAFSILYNIDRSPSDKRILYDEMKISYDNVKSSGADEVEVQKAWSDWVVQGFKEEVENALLRINRLTNRSSVYQAQNENSSLTEPDGLAFLHQGNTQFAPVYFTPISAVSKETWMEAEVSFNDLDAATSNSPYKSQWKSYRGVRRGKITFKYVVLECLRPWFTQSLYETDDWKLDNNNDIVSAGNGKDGIVPAYVSSAYLCSVESIKVASTINDMYKPTYTKNRLLNSKQKLSSSALRINTKVRSISGVKSKGNSNSILSSKLRPKITLGTGQLAIKYKPLNRGGKLRILTTIDLNKRHLLALQLLDNPNVTINTNTTSNLNYIVGFGCSKIPASPNPNQDYEW